VKGEQYNPSGKRLKGGSMSDIPKDLLYSKEHEWVKMEDDIAVIGITDYAQSELGDIVYVEMPSEGAQFNRMDVIGNIEAVKTVAELFTPLSGTIVEVNGGLEDSPERINQEPYGDGWIVKVKAKDPAEAEELLPPEEYEKLAGAE
jgi:glycine cleavage system H protein